MSEEGSTYTYMLHGWWIIMILLFIGEFSRSASSALVVDLIHSCTLKNLQCVMSVL